MAKNNRLVMFRLLLLLLLIIIITIAASVAVAESYDPMCTESSTSTSNGSATTINGGVYYYNRACSTQYFPWNSTELQGYVLDNIETSFHNAQQYSRRFCDGGRRYGARDRPVAEDLVTDVTVVSYASCGEGYDLQVCAECLEGASRLISNRCDGSSGVRAWSGICCARYEQDYKFCSTS